MRYIKADLLSTRQTAVAWSSLLQADCWFHCQTEDLVTGDILPTTPVVTRANLRLLSEINSSYRVSWHFRAFRLSS
jgi:hypothetical protein